MLGGFLAPFRGESGVLRAFGAECEALGSSRMGGKMWLGMTRRFFGRLASGWASADSAFTVFIHCRAALRFQLEFVISLIAIFEAYDTQWFLGKCAFL